MQLLFQPTAYLPARHSMIASIQINVDHCRVWVFFNELGAVSQCPNNMEVSKAFHPKKIYISQVHHLPSPWVLNRNITNIAFPCPKLPCLETPPTVPRNPIPIVAAPRNPWFRASKPLIPCLETPDSVPRNPWFHASKPHLRRASKPLGTKSETKIFKFRWFLGPSEQNELYHTPILSKIWDLSDRNFFGGGSL